MGGQMMLSPLGSHDATSSYHYEPTAEDRLWLLRAVEAEGSPRSMVARALVNLFVHQRTTGGKRTLAQVVRAYAQPVNPRWFEDGDLFLSKPRTEQERTLARKRKALHSTRTVFSPQTVAAVREALSTSWLSDVTDYAAPNVDATDKGYTPRSEKRAGENRFWTRVPGWAGYAALGNGASVALALALMAVVIWSLRA